MIKWIATAIAAFFLLMVFLVVLAALSGFADVPCQDGVWDAQKQICIQTHM